MTKTIRQHLELFEDITISEASKLNFIGVQPNDVYNITKPFLDKGKMIIAGRVEARDSEDSNVLFFENIHGDHWQVISELPCFNLQDPFVQVINNELIFGGVKTYLINENPRQLGWKTVFYKGDCIANLKEFYAGPKGMKDIRMIQLHDNRIGVMTRPQSSNPATGGRGKIGFLVINSFDELSDDKVLSAPLLDLFIDEEWGGANELFKLENNKLGILGHIAMFDELEHRHYYSMVFEYDYINNLVSNYKIIAQRKQFKAGTPKRVDLEDVIFSGGLSVSDTDGYHLYVGVSDTHAQYIKVTNPFSCRIL